MVELWCPTTELRWQSHDGKGYWLAQKWLSSHGVEEWRKVEAVTIPPVNFAGPLAGLGDPAPETLGRRIARWLNRY